MQLLSWDMKMIQNTNWMTLFGLLFRLFVELVERFPQCKLCTVHAIKVYSNKYMLIKTCRWKRVMWSTLKQETRNEKKKKKQKKKKNVEVPCGSVEAITANCEIKNKTFPNICEHGFVSEWPFDISPMHCTNRFNAYWVLEWLDTNWGSQFVCKLSVLLFRPGIIVVLSIDIEFVFFSL